MSQDASWQDRVNKLVSGTLQEQMRMLAEETRDRFARIEELLAKREQAGSSDAIAPLLEEIRARLDATASRAVADGSASGGAEALAAIEAQLTQIERDFSGMERQLVDSEQHLLAVERRFGEVEERLADIPQREDLTQGLEQAALLMDQSVRHESTALADRLDSLAERVSTLNSWMESTGLSELGGRLARIEERLEGMARLEDMARAVEIAIEEARRDVTVQSSVQEVTERLVALEEALRNAPRESRTTYLEPRPHAAT